MSMLTLTYMTRFRVMRSCQEQIREVCGSSEQYIAIGGGVLHLVSKLDSLAIR